MMSRTTEDPETEKNRPLRNEDCERCAGQGLLGPGYWDEELDWYILPEGTRVCPDCEGVGEKLTVFVSPK